ncbi:endoribonuclease MazF [Salmonella enterica]|nr:endoribonuclease MazF [Salmonella enterica]
MNKAFNPGDIVMIECDPSVGHEQSGTRPAVVISPSRYNKATGLFVCVVCTTKIKGYPFEVAISGTPRPTVALADHIRSFDYLARKARVIGAVEPDELAQIQGKIKGFLF